MTTQYNNDYNKIKQDYCIYDSDDYDNIDGIVDTKTFTVLDNIEIIDENHNFISFLNGFLHNLFNIIILHGWYHKPSNNVKFIIRNHPADVGNIIYFAWQEYIKYKEQINNTEYYATVSSNISIYYFDCGRLYKSNEYNIDKNIFYKQFI